MARFQGQGKAVRGMFGKATSATTAAGKSVYRSASKHKVMYGVGGLMAAGGLAAGRRGPGTSKVNGRPTGIYGH